MDALPTYYRAFKIIPLCSLSPPHTPSYQVLTLTDDVALHGTAAGEFPSDSAGYAAAGAAAKGSDRRAARGGTFQAARGR